MDSLFSACDKNKDNVLNFKEFKALCHTLFKTKDGQVYKLEENKIQEMFSVFDRNNDNYIDKNEFKFCWNYWVYPILHPRSALIVVDVQNDFISGSLAIDKCPANQDGYEVIDPINNLLATVKFDTVIYTLDWHPGNHISFIDNIGLRKIDPLSKVNSSNAKMYDTVVFKNPHKITQTLWPRHCIQHSWGAELHQDLKVIDTAIKIYKGTNPDVDSYSGFCDNKCTTATSLNSELRARNISDLYICGLAYDVCVGATASDALNIGYRTIVIEDCSRGIEERSIEETKCEIIKNNGVVVNSSAVKAMVQGKDRRPELGYMLALNLKKIIQ